VESKGRVVRESIQVYVEPQRANPPPIELRNQMFVECRRKKARGTLRDRYFLFPSAFALEPIRLVSLTTSVMLAGMRHKQHVCVC
jgi:hypothetical protein